MKVCMKSVFTLFRASIFRENKIYCSNIIIWEKQFYNANYDVHAIHKKYEPLFCAIVLIRKMCGRMCYQRPAKVGEIKLNLN